MKGARVTEPGNQLKGELWQVLTHAFANSLIAVGLVMVLAGLSATVILPHKQFWVRFSVAGAALAAAAFALHLIAWV